MKDLQIKFVKDGKEIVREFDTIIDFTSYYEVSKDKKDAYNDVSDITAIFFEKPILTKKFNNISALYEHCRDIMT